MLSVLPRIIISFAIHHTVFGLPWPQSRERYSPLPPTQSHTPTHIFFWLLWTAATVFLIPLIETLNCYNWKILKVLYAHKPFYYCAFYWQLLFYMNPLVLPWALKAGGAKLHKAIQYQSRHKMLAHFICVYSYSVSQCQPCSFDCIGSCVSRVKVGQRAYQKCQLAPECWCIGSCHVNTQCRLPSHGDSKWSECWLNKKYLKWLCIVLQRINLILVGVAPMGYSFVYSRAHVIQNSIQAQKCSNKLWHIKQHECKTHTNVCGNDMLVQTHM